MKYGVKALLTYSVENSPRLFYEEMILAVQAESSEEAFDKAEAYLRGYEVEYTNPDNQRVKTIRSEILDCFLSFDAENGVEEVYSSFTTNQSALCEDDYYALLTAQCEKEELHPLQNREFNDKLI